MTKTLRFILGDQLTRSLSALEGVDPARDVLLMVEVGAEATYVRHHKQKITLIFSAMRHFAQDLRAEGLNVDYVTLDDLANTGDFSGELARAITRHSPDSVVMTEPGEWRVREMMEVWRETLPVPLHIRPDTRFIASTDEFSRWAAGRKTYRMEFFYREMRRKTGLLMEGDKPEGGEWNYDSENRKPLPKVYAPPARKRFAPDAITREVMALVEARFSNHFGDLSTFGWPVTRAEALEALSDFITHHLPNFGDYQDAMKKGADFLHHSLVSTSLNIGLLTPLEVAEAAEAAYRRGDAPLNATEGFIRQVIGWRDYVRGLYWHEMPGYAATNALDAQRPLPDFFWSGQSGMACMDDVITATRRNAYAHHIQRLMVTGNFALLAGLAPAAVEEWYLLVYADAFEWVELPNVHGMVLYADGGLLASKPYAASGAYIDRMSDYCAGCRYSPAIKTGEGACPFNLLYWDFLMRNEAQLAGNPRMAMPYRTLAKMDAARKAQIRAEAQVFLDGMV